jgi:hypothetical protein
VRSRSSTDVREQGTVGVLFAGWQRGSVFQCRKPLVRGSPGGKHFAVERRTSGIAHVFRGPAILREPGRPVRAGCLSTSTKPIAAVNTTTNTTRAMRTADRTNLALTTSMRRRPSGKVRWPPANYCVKLSAGRSPRPAAEPPRVSLDARRHAACIRVNVKCGKRRAACRRMHAGPRCSLRDERCADWHREPA